mgnify:CR=1 FL=1
MASRGLNKVQIIGNLGRDPEMRYLPSGKAVTNFTVAVGRTWRDQASGENREETEWFRVEAWDKLGEFCSQYLKKGMRVYAEGRIRTREYDDRNGVKRMSVDLIANEVLMLDSRQDSDRLRGEAAGAGVPAGRGGGPTADSGDGDDEDMPF